MQNIETECYHAERGNKSDRLYNVLKKHQYPREYYCIYIMYVLLLSNEGNKLGYYQE